MNQHYSIPEKGLFRLSIVVCRINHQICKLLSGLILHLYSYFRTIHKIFPSLIYCTKTARLLSGYGQDNRQVDDHIRLGIYILCERHDFVMVHT